MAKSGGSTTMKASGLALGIACLLMIAMSMNGVQCDPIGARRGLVGETVFDVTKFGAKADGKFSNEMNIIRAWRAACDSTGPAKLLVPTAPQPFVAGEIVLAGPCAGNKPITIEIQGKIQATSDPSAFSNGAFIMIKSVDNLLVTGGGTIDGNGAKFWKYATSGGEPLGVGLVFEHVGFAKLDKLNSLNSMGFHIKVTDSHDVALSNLVITAPADSPNTDGVHISNTTNVNVTDSTIGTGDDCVSIGHGSVNAHVARVTCGPGHGISIGSLGKRPNEIDVKGVTVTNCTLKGTTNGARIKTYHNSPPIHASGIVFEDIVMQTVRNPIVIDQHYASKKKPGQSKVKITDVHFRNIRGTSISAVSVSLNCSAVAPCEGIELSNINLQPANPTVGPLTSACANAKASVRGTLSLNPSGLAACK